MTTIDYLPRGDKTGSISGVLDNWNSKLYFVGPSARKRIYSFTHAIDGFDFVIDGNPEDDYNSVMEEDLEGEGLSYIKPTNHVYNIDCNGYDVRVVIQPVAEFLTDKDYAGDGVAIQVATGRVVCTPEFVTLPPTMKIDADTPDENAPESLKVFERELVALARKLANERPAEA